MEKTKIQLILRIILFCSVLVLPLIIVELVSASRILLETTITTEFVKAVTHRFPEASPQEPQTPGDKLKVIVRIKNTGDESAFGVVPAIVLSEVDLLIDEVKDLPAGQNFTWQNTFDLETLGIGLPGTYVLPMLVMFKDANGYPISTPAIHRFDRDKASSGRIAIKPKAATVALPGKTTTSIILRNTGSVGKEVSVSVLHAKEIASSIKSNSISLPPNAREEIRIEFENFRALPGSTAVIHYVVQYQNKGVHYCEVANNRLLVSKRKGLNSLLANSWLFVLAIVMVICVYAALVWKKKKKNG